MYEFPSDMFRTWQKSRAVLMFIEGENEAWKVDML